MLEDMRENKSIQDTTWEEYEKLIENQKNEIANGGQKLWNNFSLYIG